MVGGQMTLPKMYQSYAEFEREILRPNRVSFSLEDIVEEEGSFEAELDFERDPFDVPDDD
jgi:hypothetical protein